MKELREEPGRALILATCVAQTAGTTPQPQLTRLARRASTPGSTKAVIRGRPMAGMPDKAEQPGAEEQPADNACGAEQSPEKQCKAVRKGSAESASGGKSAVGRSFLTPFTAPHRVDSAACQNFAASRSFVCSCGRASESLTGREAYTACFVCQHTCIAVRALKDFPRVNSRWHPCRHSLG